MDKHRHDTIRMQVLKRAIREAHEGRAEKINVRVRINERTIEYYALIKLKRK